MQYKILTTQYTEKRRSGLASIRRIRSACVGLLLALGAMPLLAQPLLDCPLRDTLYSADIPVIDLLLNDRARALVDEFYPGIFAKLPPRMLRTEAPSFGAIISLDSLVDMVRMSKDKLPELNARLAELEVTDADRRARCARYDNDDPGFKLGDEAIQVLVFDKINGFDHGPSVTAATDAIRKLAGELGWGVAVTNKGGAFRPANLSKFDVVVWNNNSGDVLTLSQRDAFENYIRNGGGFLGIHGSGGDSVYFWDFYVDKLIGASFIGHPADPQFQDADLHVEASPSGIAESLVSGWTMNDEWYSFAESPRNKGVDVVLTIDESTYVPEGYGAQNLRMGVDHPIVWSQCVGKGRAMYSAIGHRPEVYQVAENMMLLKGGLVWTAGQGKTRCAIE